METQTLQEYFNNAGVDVDVGNTDLHYVTIDNAVSCWRHGERFVFGDLSDIDGVRDIRIRLIVKYHPDRNGGDDTMFNKLHGFIKVGCPDTATVTTVMYMLSSVYKKLMRDDIETMSINTLHHYCLNFMDSVRYIQSVVKNKTSGIAFIDVPGISCRVKFMLGRFHTKMKDTLYAFGDSKGVMDAYNDMVCANRLPEKRFIINSFKEASHASVVNVIRSGGATESILFSASTSALQRTFYTFISIGQAEFDMFKERVIGTNDVDVVAPALAPTPTSTSTSTSTPTPHVQKRPTVRPTRLKTWREKRPRMIVTDIKIKEMSPRVVRKSRRLLKLHPRRSMRLKV
jgi:hypothetical protein